MSVYEYSAIDIDGEKQDLSQYEGKVLLIVNTASKCGFAPQFQEDEAGIKNFCELNYGVTFPMFSKIDVNGENAHPLFRYLRKETKGLLGDSVKWNFTKFLVGKDGKVIRRYAPQVDPMDIEKDIREIL